MSIFLKNFKFIDYINQLIKLITNNKVRDSIINFFDTKYSKEIASFMKLILLNIKSKDSYIFYNQVVDLGIV